MLCSWARHVTLAVPFSTQGYKWFPAILMLRDIARCLMIWKLGFKLRLYLFLVDMDSQTTYSMIIILYLSSDCKVGIIPVTRLAYT